MNIIGKALWGIITDYQNGRHLEVFDVGTAALHIEQVSVW